MPVIPVPHLLFQNCLAESGSLQTGCLKISVHHNGDEIMERNFWFPAKPLVRLGGIRDKDVYFEWTHVPIGDFYITAPVKADICECYFHEFADGVGFAGANDEIIRRVMLDDPPDRLDVFGRIAPVTASVEIAKEKRVLITSKDRSNSSRNLSGDEGFTPARALVIEEDAGAGKEAVTFAIDTGHPVRVEFGGGIRTSRLKNGSFILWREGGAEHFGARGLIKLGLRTAAADSLEKTHRAKPTDISSVLGHVETYPNMTLCGKVVEFVGLKTIDKILTPFRAGNIPVMEEETGAGMIGVLINVIDTLGIKRARAANNAVNFIPLG